MRLRWWGWPGISPALGEPAAPLRAALGCLGVVLGVVVGCCSVAVLELAAFVDEYDLRLGGRAGDGSSRPTPDRPAPAEGPEKEGALVLRGGVDKGEAVKLLPRDLQAAARLDQLAVLDRCVEVVHRSLTPEQAVTPGLLG